jgi:hypothetical protein
VFQDEFSNPYHGIEYAPAINKFKVVVGSHPQRLVGVYDTLKEAMHARNIERAKELRAPRETATYPKFFETRQHAV